MTCAGWTRSSRMRRVGVGGEVLGPFQLLRDEACSPPWSSSRGRAEREDGNWDPGPPELVEALGGGERGKVAVTIGTGTATRWWLG